MTRSLDRTAMAPFADEVRADIPAILDALAAAERDRSDREAVQEAYRLVHALKGAAAMVGLAALAHLLDRAELLLDQPVTAGSPLDDGRIALLRTVVPQFGRYVDAALAGEPADVIALEVSQCYRDSGVAPGEAPDDDAALRDLLESERAGLPPAESAPATPDAEVAPAPAANAVLPDLAPSEPIPPELAEVFAQESQEHLQTIARLTARVSSEPPDQDTIQELRRSVHTIKGAAAVVGYKAASRLAHRMEDLLDRLYDGSDVVTPDSARLMASSSDALEDVITGTADPAVLSETLVRLFAQYDALLPQTPAPAPAPPEERRRNADRRRNVDDRRQRGGAQVVRVPFQRLSELVRLVSELVITRSSFDQHYAALIDQVDEVKLSTARLRRVALKLESDYEVRALAGNMASPGPGAPQNATYGFDELEFDRYTGFHLVSRELTETAGDIGTISTRLGETIGNFEGDLRRLGRLTREVQDKVMEFRMVPLVTLASRLERAVRVTAEECGKAVDLVLEGETVALDKTLLEEMTDPLLHLLRNAVDHGIEPPPVRAADAKPERGRIVVRAAHEGTDVLIEVEDDGGGLDVERIRQTAVSRGQLAEAEAAALGSEELFGFIFQPGFSTATRISEVSGRGVGLDVVRSKVNRLGGRIHVTSQPKIGTTITVRVPMTLAITRILLVRAGAQLMGVPLGAVVQIVRSDAASISSVGAERVVTVDRQTYPLRDLASTLGLAQSAEASKSAQRVLIVSLAGRLVGLAVDEIVQSRDVVVKTLGTHLRRVTGVWGATLLGDGTVVLILNPTDLAGSVDEPRARQPLRMPAPHAERQPYTILIVDDSLSMRHVLSNGVKTAGWTPLQARDGVEALEILHRASSPPDLVLLDIEMPRMDGYEFLSTLRAQPAHAGLPVVMLTSRGGDKHREKAMALGATDYIVKPFQQDALLANVDRLIRAARAGARKVAS